MKDKYIYENYNKLSEEITKISNEYFFKESFNEIHPKKSEEELIAFWNKELPKTGCSIEEVINDIKEGFMTGITGIANPNFLGYVLARPVPESHAFDMLANATHATPGATHLSVSATLIERCTLRWFAEAMNISEFRGMFTNCGSVSNLIALKCARDQMISRDKGITKPIVVYGSEESHYSLRRAWDVLGGGIEQVRTFKSNKLDELKDKIREDRENGYLPIAIMGNLGTTNTGEIEPIKELLEICKQEKLWFHIDGAYGAPILFRKEYSYLQEFVQQADSINIDPHKWIGMPAGTSSIYLNFKHSFLKSFACGAQFLDFQNMDCDTDDQCQMGIEGTRRFYGLRVWGALKLLGFKKIQYRIRESMRLAQYLAEKLREIPEVEVLNKVELSVVTFAIRGFDNRGLMLLTKRLFERNEAFITVTKVHEKDALRCCIIDYEITEESLNGVVKALIDSIRVICEK